MFCVAALCSQLFAAHAQNGKWPDHSAVQWTLPLFQGFMCLRWCPADFEDAKPVDWSNPCPSLGPRHGHCIRQSVTSSANTRRRCCRHGNVILCLRWLVTCWSTLRPLVDQLRNRPNFTAFCRRNTPFHEIGISLLIKLPPQTFDLLSGF